MPDVKLPSTLHPVFALRAILAILKLHVLFVSIGNACCTLLCFPSNILHVVLPVVGLPVEPVVSVGCSSNSDCPDYTACENQKCINPCASNSPCAPTAICKTVHHEAVCTCPDGYIGSPLVDCIIRKCVQWSWSYLNTFVCMFWCLFFIDACLNFSSKAWMYHQWRLPIDTCMHTTEMPESLHQILLWPKCWMQSQKA